MAPTITDTGTPVAGIDPANAVQILPPGVARANRQLWLAARRTGIGGSDISTLVGLNRWSSRYELWLDKTGQLPLVDEQSEAAEMGLLLEPVVRDRFARAQHLTVTPAGTLRSTRWPWMLANPDGMCSDGDGYEGKTCSMWQAHEWAHGQTADHAELQAQWGMAVTGLAGWWVAVLIGGQRNTYRHVDRDNTLIGELVAISDRFWTRHVQPRIEPDADGTAACTDILNARYPQPEPGVEIQVNDETADQLADAKTRAANAEKTARREHEQIKNRARQLIGSGERLVAGERVVATWTHIEALNMGRLTADHPDLVEQYTVPVKTDEFNVDAFRVEQPDIYKAYRQRRLHFQ